MTTTRKLVLSEQASLIEQVQRIAEGRRDVRAVHRGRGSRPAHAEVRDPRDPQQPVGARRRRSRDRAGLARIADDDFPPVLANYPNRFADGRTAKSTSIGIKDSTGRYVAALCLNADVTLFRGFQGMLNQFCSTEGEAVAETLDPAGADAIRQRIDAFAMRPRRRRAN